MSFSPNARVAHYEILHLLGAGGMGEVYLARDTRLGREVALKVLPASVAHDPNRLARLEREARTVAALNHPGIVTLFGIEQIGDMRVLVMERVTGEPLAALIRAGPVPLARLLPLAIQMADALAAAHDEGIVHRDLKPGNVMVTAQGRVKVLDFGLATRSPVVSADGTTVTLDAMTGEGQLLGTVPYMAPEQLRGERVDPRSDVFALGALLYELASGARPFQGASTLEIAASVLRTEPTPLDSLRRDLPSRLVRTIQRCLEKNPRDRIQSVVDLLHQLQDISNEVQPASGGRTHDAGRVAVAAPVAAPDAGYAVAARAAHRRRVRMLAGTAAGILVIGALLSWALRSRPAAASSGSGIRSVAVLPFENLMHDASQDYFVDGMHDALITEVAKLGTVRVISRNAVMPYKNHPQSLKTVARDLGVDALIEGSVLRAGKRVRITAQLINGRTDEHVWADSYDRNLEDVLKLLNDVSHAIAHELQLTLGGASPPAAAAQVLSVKPDAYEAFLRGQQALRRDIAPATIRSALGHLEDAVRIDPTLGRAWSSISFCYLISGVFGRVPVAEAAPVARAAAEKALAVDPDDGLGLGALGALELYFDWQFDSARRHLEEAVRLSPHRIMIRHAYADYLMITGQTEASLKQVRLARDDDPAAPLINAVVLQHILATRRYDEVLAEARRISPRIPDTPSLHTAIGEALWMQGRYEQALPEFERSLPAAAWQTFEAGFLHDGPLAAYRAYGEYLKTLPPDEQPNPYAMAQVYASAGERDTMFRCLEKAYVVRLPQLLHVAADPVFDGVRRDSRFLNLLRRVGIGDDNDSAR
jgi:serine/threonine-protein kinase